MNKGLVDLAKLRKNISKADHYGKSSFGFINGDKFIKVYAKEEDNKFEVFIPPNPHQLTDFSGLEADTIIFPNEYILENGLKAGEISDYINDQRFDLALKTKLEINPMISSYDDVISDMYLYSDIDMIDLCFANILYSNKNGFHIIDTTDWCFDKNSLEKNIYRFNLSIVKEIIDYLEVPYTETYYGNSLRYYVYNNYLNILKKYGDSGERLIKYLMLLKKDRYNFQELMFAYQDVYRIHYGMEANTLNDVKELTKVIKKG